MNDITYWSVFSKEGSAQYWTISKTQEGTVENFLHDLIFFSWEEALEMGYTIKEIKIIPVE